MGMIEHDVAHTRNHKLTHYNLAHKPILGDTCRCLMGHCGDGGTAVTQQCAPCLCFELSGTLCIGSVASEGIQHGWQREWA